MIGFLDIDGTFYPCAVWEHNYKAKELCNELGFSTKMGDLDEDTLLKNGFICIRAHDAYKKAYNDDGEVLFISDAQQEWLKNNWDKFNDCQKAYLDELLRDFGQLFKWHSRGQFDEKLPDFVSGERTTEERSEGK